MSEASVERALREAEERLRFVIDNAPIILWAFGEDGVLTLSKGQGLRRVGIEPDANVGRSLWELYGLSPWNFVSGHEEANGVAVVEGEMGGIWYETRYVQVRDEAGRLVEVVAVSTDITERKRAEAALARTLEKERAARAAAEESERRAALIAELSRVLAEPRPLDARLRAVAQLVVPLLGDWCVFDLLEEDGAFRRVCAAHADPGRSADVHAIERFAPDPAAPHGIPKVVRVGQPAMYADISEAMLQPSADRWPPLGTRRPEHLEALRRLGLRSYMCVPILVSGGAAGALTFASSSDPRRFGVFEMALADDVARRVAMAVENARLYESSQEGVRARDEFLSIASHELRTPVTTLQLAVQSVVRPLRAGTPLPPEATLQALEASERQIRRLAHLVDSLLDVSRVSAGLLHLQIEPCDLASVARDVVAALSAEAERAGCAVDVQTPPTCVGLWDRSRLEQVATNLLTNAIKYGAGKPVSVGVEATGGTARFWVTDRGIGIPVAHVERVFERFERAASPAHYGGLGLGLYIVKRIVEALEGTVRVKSAPGAGSTFTVELPCERGPGQ